MSNVSFSYLKQQYMNDVSFSYLKQQYMNEQCQF